MKLHRYCLAASILVTFALIFTGQALAGDIDAKLPDSDDTSSFQVKDSADNVLMKVQSGGNVGIGTDSPNSLLDIDDSSNPYMSFSKDGERVGHIDVDSDGKMWVGTDGAHDLILFTQDGQDVTIQSGGNVGIGTTSPDEKLDVNGNVQISGTNGKLVFPSSHYDVKIELYKGGDEKIGTSDNQLMLIAGSGATDNIAFFGDSTEVMRVETGDGNVGIGTTNPRYKLDVIGDIRATGSVYYEGTSGSANGTAYTKPDYVFQEGYKKMSTEDVAGYLEKEGHLPWLTSLKREKEENGEMVNMTRMAFETVETVENLQLQIVELSKLVSAQQKQIKQLLTILGKGK
jgi:hypothetical protein